MFYISNMIHEYSKQSLKFSGYCCSIGGNSLKNYEITEHGMKEIPFTPEQFINTGSDYILFITPDELLQMAESLQIPQDSAKELSDDVIQKPRLEVYDKLTFGTINFIKQHATKLRAEEMHFFLTGNNLTIVCPHQYPPAENAWKKLHNQTQTMISVQSQRDRFLFLLLDEIISGDMHAIRNLEKEVVILEEKLLRSKEKNMRNILFRLRKDALMLQDNVERMTALAEDLSDNENKLLNPASIRYFRLAQARFERLSRSVDTLKESITQLREAYQAQIDIDANNIMKTLTIISAVFMPLTLITGWYGMNFTSMPELQWSFGYFYVAALSVIVLIASIILLYFKRNHDS